MGKRTSQPSLRPPPERTAISSSPSVPPWTLILALTILAGGLRFYQLDDQPLWLDESFSWMAAREAVPASQDVHPPLYYSLLRAWLEGIRSWGIPGIAPNDSEFWLRAPSALAATLSIPVIFALGRVLGGVPVGVTTALLFALAPFQVRFGQEARAYALLTLGAVVAMWALASLLSRQAAGNVAPPPGPQQRFLRSEQGLHWAGYVAGVVVALYCHNTAVFLPLAANIIVLVAFLRGELQGRSFVRRWLLAQGIVLLFWIPWIPSLLAQTGAVLSGYWIPDPEFAHVVDGLRELLWNTKFSLLADSTVAVLAGLGLFAWRRQPVSVLVAAGFFLVPLIGELLVSQIQPIFLTRTLVWTMVPLYALISLGLWGTLKRSQRMAGIVLALGLHLFALSAYYLSFQKEAWDKAVVYSAEQVSSRNVRLIFFDRGYVQTAFQYYFRRYPLEVDWAPLNEPERVDVDIRQRLQNHTPGERVLLVFSHTGGDTRSADTLRSLGTMLEGQNYNGVIVALFELK